MPKESAHQTQWYSNGLILDDLVNANRFPDWITIAAFYKALHSIERLLARHKEHPKSHAERRKILSQTKYQTLLTAQIVTDYFDMYNASLDARYECIIPTTTDVNDQLARLARIDAKVASIP